MRAILIDPFKQTLEEISIPKDNYSSMSKILGLNMLEPVFDEDCTIILDEEGLLKEQKAHWNYANYSKSPFTGKALIIGMPTPDGEETLELTLTLAEIQARVVFRPDIRFAGFVMEEGITDHPILGNIAYIARKATFEKIKKDN